MNPLLNSRVRLFNSFTRAIVGACVRECAVSILKNLRLVRVLLHIYVLIPWFGQKHAHMRAYIRIHCKNLLNPLLDSTRRLFVTKYLRS
jgi:hypothetical protein